MTRKTTILLLFFLIVLNFFGQTKNVREQSPSVYSNWISIDYQNCLKTDLPCECEKSKEYFLLSLDTVRKFVLLYEGRANYEEVFYKFEKTSNTSYELYEQEYSQISFKDTTYFIGHIIIKNDSLIFTDVHSKQTKFVFYSTGEIDNYFYENVKLLNSALTIRGYDNLNKILKSDSLKCWCNWELDGGLNLVFSKGRDWLLEQKNNELYIYEWINIPKEKNLDLKIEKILIKKLKW